MELKIRPSTFLYPLQPALLVGIFTVKSQESEQIVIGPPFDRMNGVALHFDSDGQLLKAETDFFSSCPSAGMTTSPFLLFAEKQAQNESLGLELATVRIRGFEARAGGLYFCLRDYPLHYADVVAHELTDEGIPFKDREVLRQSMAAWFDQGFFELDWADGIYEVPRKGIIHGT